MRLLLDENIGIKRWAQVLIEHGHEVQRVVDIGLMGANDSEIVRFAYEHGLAIVSREKAKGSGTDLQNQWQRLPSPRPLLLLIAPGKFLTPEEIAKAISKIQKQKIKDQICYLNAWCSGSR